MVKPRNLINIVDSILNIPRIGWIQRGIPVSIAETVGDHTLLTSYLALVLCNELTSKNAKIDSGKCLIMALVHDIHESIIGNVGSNVRSSIPNWYDLEVKAFESLDLPGEFTELFKEYRYGTTTEGLIIQLADKMATLLRACGYSRRGYDVSELIINYKESVNKVLNALPKDLYDVLREFVNDALSGCDDGTGV